MYSVAERRKLKYLVKKSVTTNVFAFYTSRYMI